jgi:hypothetical protein
VAGSTKVDSQIPERRRKPPHEWTRQGTKGFLGLRMKAGARQQHRRSLDPDEWLVRLHADTELWRTRARMSLQQRPTNMTKSRHPCGCVGGGLFCPLTRGPLMSGHTVYTVDPATQFPHQHACLPTLVRARSLLFVLRGGRSTGFMMLRSAPDISCPPRGGGPVLVLAPSDRGRAPTARFRRKTGVHRLVGITCRGREPRGLTSPRGQTASRTP